MNAIAGTRRAAVILVIDDDEIMRDLVADWLEAADYGVRKAADGAAGLAEVERAQPALVVTDMCMPGPGGGAVIRRLRLDHPAIPIIAISGHYNMSGCSAADALNLGAARALAKPIKRNEVVRAVAELIGPPEAGALSPLTRGRAEDAAREPGDGGGNLQCAAVSPPP
jgi:CheY-like chemotaxis protein